MRSYTPTGIFLSLICPGLCTAVEDSGTNMLSEIHDKILSSAAQDRQDTGTTAPIAHSQLDSQEKQRMIKAYGNLVEEDEEYLVMQCC